MEPVFEQVFDNVTKSQIVNDEVSVMHCHHYSALFTKLALDQKELGGPMLLTQAIGDAIWTKLTKYFLINKIDNKQEMVKHAETYYSNVGMGKIEINITRVGGEATLTQSHIDDGWKLKNWPKPAGPINFVTCGFLAAVATLVNDMPIRSYKVTETSSIILGDKVSKFVIEEHAHD